MTVSFRQLQVWQKAMELVVQVYSVARAFPKHEQFGLTNQITRATVSIPANIAEGNARASRKDYAHFISIARGSLAEVETLLMIALRLGYTDQPAMKSLEPRLDKLGRMLNAFHRKLSVSSPSSPVPHPEAR